mgnify:CR=1 FL=1|jgi:hypothetical protein
MKLKRIICIVIATLVIMTSFSSQAFAKEKNTVDTDENFIENRVIVKLANNNYTKNMCEITKDSFDLDCSDIHLLNPSKSIKIQDNNEYSVADITDKQNNMFVLTLEESGKESVKSALKILNNSLVQQLKLLNQTIIRNVQLRQMICIIPVNMHYKK